MNTLSFKTKSANKATVQRDWYIIDVADKKPGRIGSRIAAVLRGKNKPYYTPHVDCGDHVIVINADKVSFSGHKLEQKEYISYSGYPGGQKREVAGKLLERRPEAVIEKTVKGMLPKNKLGRQMYKKLHVYAGEEHPHQAQKPQPLKF